MASQQVKSLNIKKLSFTESQLPSDFFKPLTATSDYRKTLQSKAYATQNTHNSITNITNSDGLSHILSNNSTLRLEKGKSSRSFKMTLETQIPKENPSKPSTTLAEIYAPLSPSTKEIASHRQMKSVSHVIRSPLDVKSLSPSYNNLKQIVKSSARVNPVGFGNLNETVNKKMEEINYLRKSIQDLKNKKQELIHKEKQLLEEIETQPVIEQEIAQKDKIIEVYEKLLRLCSKKPRSPTKAVLGEYDPITDDLRNRVLQAQKNEVSSNLRKLIFVDTHFNTVSTPKSMHEFPNSAKIYPHSPSARIGGASFFESKTLTPSQEVNSAKDHTRRLSLSHRPSSHRTSQFLQQKNNNKQQRVRKVDISPGHRLVFKSSKQSSISSPKMVFSRSLNPSVDIGAQDSTLEKEDFTGTNETSDVYSRETDIYTNPSIHRRKVKTSGKLESESEICGQLGSVVEKFRNVFKKYEEGNVALIKMNEELRKKINHFCVSKNGLSS